MLPLFIRRFLPVVVVTSVALPLRAQSPDGDAVVATVQRLFDAMRTRDTLAARRLLAPASRFIALRGDTLHASFTPQSDSSFLRFLAAGTDHYLERIWSPQVQVRGGMATVWAPYDFHLNGTRTHCGVDAFTLVRTGSGWQILDTTYTGERTDCGTSPLGPPR